MKARIVFILLGSMFLTSCSAWFSESEKEDRRTSSLVKYLYADGSYPEYEPETPTLKLPLKVGIAFIPSQVTKAGGINTQNEIELLDDVKKAFVNYDYIDRIEIIPSAYLANGQGFTTLEQISRLYDVDIMALVSYDQVSRSSLNPSSLLYWTIVGAYIIPGNNNVTQTFVDTAVFDISTHKLLFRAPGINKVKGYATAVAATSDANVKSVKSYQNAVVDMTGNLDLELARFKTRVKEEKIAKVEIRQGYSGASYSGGGSAGPMLLFLLVLVLAVRLVRSHNFNQDIAVVAAGIRDNMTKGLCGPDQASNPQGC